MAVLLALTSAVVYGAADFCGGLAARRAAALAVVAVSQLAGLVTCWPCCPPSAVTRPLPAWPGGRRRGWPERSGWCCSTGRSPPG